MDATGAGASGSGRGVERPVFTEMNVDEDLKTLELEPGATDDDIRKAWRDLTKVWHPDRFGSDPELRERAENKLKEINAAYERLRENGSRRRWSGSHQTRSRPSSPDAASAPWRVRGGGKEVVAANFHVLLTWVARGNVDERDEVFHPVAQQWMPLTAVPEAAAVLAARRRIHVWRRVLVAGSIALFIFLRRPSLGGFVTALIVFLGVFSLFGGPKRGEADDR